MWQVKLQLWAAGPFYLWAADQFLSGPNQWNPATQSQASGTATSTEKELVSPLAHCSYKTVAVFLN